LNGVFTIWFRYVHGEHRVAYTELDEDGIKQNLEQTVKTTYNDLQCASGPAISKTLDAHLLAAPFTLSFTLSLDRDHLVGVDTSDNIGPQPPSIPHDCRVQQWHPYLTRE